jgi:uncharacterized protein YdaU (DUF1376 family)
MPFYPGDFYRDTRHLSKLQRDSYMCLICHYWSTGGLPDDDTQLARITDCTLEEWQTDKPLLQAFFFGGWKHKRVEAELRRTADRIAKRRASGSKGGQVTAMKNEIARYNNQRFK